MEVWESLFKLIYGKERDWAPLIAGRTVALAGLRELQPKTWTQAGDTMVTSMKNMDFNQLNKEMISRGIFYLEEKGD